MSIKVGFGAVGIKDNKPGTLNYIASDTFRNRDIAIVIDNNILYYYRMDQYSGEDENIPYIVKPADINSSTPFESRLKRWTLVSQKYLTTDIVQTVDNFIQTRNINFNTSEFIITCSNGSKVKIYDDGKVEFPLQVHGKWPEEDDHLTTKEYLDLQLSILDTTLKDYLDDEVETFNNKEKPNLIDYIDNAMSQLNNDIINYLFDSIEDLKTTKTWDYIDENILEHNLNTKNLLINVYNDNDEKIVPDSIEFTDNNTIEIYPFTGDVVLRRGTTEEINDITQYHYEDQLVYPNDDVIYSKIVSHPIDKEIIQTEESNEWDIQHNLVNKNIIVFVFDNDGNKIIPNNVELIDRNNCIISFNKQVSGYVYLVESQYYICDSDSKLQELHDNIVGYFDNELDILESDIREYIDDKIEDAKQYVDYNIEWLEDQDVPNYTHKTWNITEWNQNGDLYYMDILHNLDINRFFIEVWSNNKMVNVDVIEIVDNNKLKIWITEPIDIVVYLFYIGEET